MAFGLDKIILKRELLKKGYHVEDSPYRDKAFLVNGKYEINYNSNHYRLAGDDKTLGQNKQSFFKLVDDDTS